jgi:prepilin-type N-terminal cleavage/methylation domain-containing protein
VEQRAERQRGAGGLAADDGVVRAVTRARQRGMTILELLISIAVVLVGMLGLFKVLAAAQVGSAQAQRFIQAQSRAGQVIEALKGMPTPVLDCLVGTQVTSWSTCETMCKAKLGPTALAQSCLFSTVNPATNSTADRTLQSYALVVDVNDATRSTWVQKAGVSQRVYDVQVTIGWNDDGTATAQPTGNLPNHRMTVRTAVFQ